MAGEPSKAQPIENPSWKVSINSEQLENNDQIPGIYNTNNVHSYYRL